MKTIIIPDIHNRVKQAEAILAHEKDYDKVVFLGDYFDSWGDSADDAKKSAWWLRHSLQNPKHIHLWGNHDISYGFRASVCKCSGYDLMKDSVINGIMTSSEYNQLRFFYFADGWFCSHAGLHPHFLPPMWKDKDVNEANLTDWLTEETRKFKRDAQNNQLHWFNLAGDSRRHYKTGVDQGGLLWCDTSEFYPIDGLPQVFGHTPQDNFPLVVRGSTGLDCMSSSEVLARSFCQKESWNIALDTHSKHYAVIIDGALTIKPTPL